MTVRQALASRRACLLLAFVLALVPRKGWPQGQPLGPEFRVNTYTTDQQTTPRFATDPSGNFVVVWLSLLQDGSGNGVFGQRYASSGLPSGPEFRVNTFLIASQSLPVAASDSSGNFVVVWMSYTQDGSSWGVFGQRYASSGIPLGSEFRVNTYTTGSQAAPSVASDPSGNFVVVWQSDGQDGLGYGVFGQRYTGSGSPAGPEFRVNTSTTNDQSLPSMAADGSGNFVVVWRSDGQDGSVGGVFGQRYASSGGALGPESRVNTYTTNEQFRPSVASDGSGDFIVAWASLQDGSDNGIFGQRYAGSGSPQGPEFRVNTDTANSQQYPFVAADPSGNFVVVWSSDGQDGSGTGIFGQRFAGSGGPLGAQFRVNTYTAGNQDRPSVAADPSGNFVVGWRSANQDGSVYGVFAQRYSEIVPVELLRFGVE
jgi:hypothetical protein